MAYKGRRPFTDLEVRTLLDAWDRDDHKFALREKAWFTYGIVTGFRFNELRHIKINAVSNRYNVISTASVEAKYTKGKNTPGKTQPIKGRFNGVSPKAILQDWLDVLKEMDQIETHHFVFQSQIGKNKPISRQWAWKRLIEICSSNGIYGPIGTHSMRKTFTRKMDTYRQGQFRRGELKEDPNRVLMKDGGWKHQESMEHYRSFKYSNWKDDALDFNN